ncbi:hypothetical protein NLD30_02380 [SCandidatus Aminicenantes bacterium Aminicenantia_JdfR_composite]|jgi:hypothetical protein|nr:hypothetical protein [SCandidatus Aminicenantes bacterium Aminicenantia_JdfR_composite]MCP2597748.1 hypothetical protein [Candidatus Aminicenantes bacterium AC-335-L06]
MEEIEILSWKTLDALKEKAKIIEKIGDLQSEYGLSIFCQIEDDYLELFYSDFESNYLRRYEDEEEFEKAIEQRKEEIGEARYEDELIGYNEEGEEEFEYEEEPEEF